MPPKARQIRMDQRSAIAEMQALEQRSDEELEREQKYRSAALSILGARAAERYDAAAARAYFQKAIAAARPQERMQIRRMADASIALAERRPDDLKEAVERLGQEAPSTRQLLLLRIAGLLAPPPGSSPWLRVRGVLLIVGLVVAAARRRLGGREARGAAVRRRRERDRRVGRNARDGRRARRPDARRPQTPGPRASRCTRRLVVRWDRSA